MHPQGSTVASDDESDGSPVADDCVDEADVGELLLQAAPSSVIVSTKPIAVVRRSPAIGNDDPFI
jgi:hypothetical protein